MTKALLENLETSCSVHRYYGSKITSVIKIGTNSAIQLKMLDIMLLGGLIDDNLKISGRYWTFSPSTLFKFRSLLLLTAFGGGSGLAAGLGVPPCSLIDLFKRL